MKQNIFSNAVRVGALCAGLAVLGAAHSEPTAAQDWRYTIKPQDTVSGLARQYLNANISWAKLANYNRLPDANIIMSGAQLRIPLRWLALKQAHAKLASSAGDVQIQLPDGTWRQAQVGESLQTGQRIQVGRNSSAKLHFADASELVIQPESTVAMDTLSVYAGGYMADTQLRLQAGRVEVHANPQRRIGQKFDVITPAAVASVRGTQFLVEAQDARTVQQTTQGQVLLQTDQGRVLVQEGYSSAAKAGAKPLAPEVTKPAPVLQNPVSRFIDFPIAFTWAAQPEVSAWVMQVGRDVQMAQLVLTQQSQDPQLNVAGLPDGHYHLRAWSLDEQGIPSKVASHTFEVNIPRQLQGPVVQMPSRYFAAGPVALQLAPLPSGQRYLVQITEDAEGRLPVWHQANASAALSIPVPPVPERPHYLWIWVY